MLILWSSEVMFQLAMGPVPWLKVGPRLGYGLIGKNSA